MKLHNTVPEVVRRRQGRRALHQSARDQLGHRVYVVEEPALRRGRVLGRLGRSFMGDGAGLDRYFQNLVVVRTYDYFLEGARR